MSNLVEIITKVPYITSKVIEITPSDLPSPKLFNVSQVDNSTVVEFTFTNPEDAEYFRCYVEEVSELLKELIVPIYDEMKRKEEASQKEKAKEKEAKKR